MSDAIKFETPLVQQARPAIAPVSAREFPNAALPFFSIRRGNIVADDGTQLQAVLQGWDADESGRVSVGPQRMVTIKNLELFVFENAAEHQRLAELFKILRPLLIEATQLAAKISGQI